MRIKNREVLIELNGERFHCAMDITMNFIGGKWKTVVLWYLKSGKKRFAELHRLMPQITERMLSITLKQLEEDGLIVREVFTSKPPLKVEYSLSEFGETLIPVLNAVAKWGRNLAEDQGKMIEV
ncbi:MAG: winged helix-turn-helix transcriptional regulator [Bacteroidia bacterium]